MDYVRPMLDICLIMEPNFTNLEDLACLESQEFAFLLGNVFSTNADIDAIKEFSSSILWFTYRRNWTAPIGGFGGPISDRGWGCMVRCGQMLLAQCLSLIHLSPNWRWNASKCNQDESIALRYRKLLRMFQDKRTVQYSIHQITQMAVSEGKQISEWLGPNTMAQVLKKLVIYDEWSNLVVHVAMDNILISSDVWVVVTQKSQKGLQNEKQNEEGNNLMDWTRPLLLLIPLRLGLTAINSCYLEAIAEFFKLQECVGILGGRPNHAVYFYGAVGEKLLYLDPHVCQEFKDLDEHPSTGVKEATDIKCEDGSLLGVSSTNSSEHLTQSIQSMNTNDATNSTSNQNLCTEGRANDVAASSLTNSYISSPYCSNSSSNCSLVEQQKNSAETASSSFPTSISKLSSRSEDFQSNSSSPEPEMPMDSLMDNSIESFVDFNSNRPNLIANDNNGEKKQGKDDLFGSNQSMKQESSSSNAFDDSTFHCPYLLSMDFKSLDPSLALGFLVRNSNEYKNLVQSLKENILTKSSPPLFEILEERPRGWPKFSLETSYLQDESFNIKEYEDLQYDSDEQFELLE